MCVYAVFWCAICCWLARALVAEMTLKTEIQQILLYLTYEFCLWKCWKVKCYFISFVGITTSDKREDFIGRSCFVFVKLMVGYYCSEIFCTIWIHKVNSEMQSLFSDAYFSVRQKNWIDSPHPYPSRPMAIAFTQLHRSVWVSSSLSLAFLYSCPLRYVPIGPFRIYCILFLSCRRNVMESGERNFSEVGSFVCHWI